MKISIRQRLIIAFISLAVVPLLLVGGILAWQSYTTLERENLKLQVEMGQGVLNKVEGFFEEVEQRLTLAGKLDALQTQDHNGQRGIFNLLMSMDMFESLRMLDQQGQTRFYLSRLGLSSVDAGNHAGDDEFVIAKMNVEVYYSPVRFDETTGEPILTIAIPFLNVHSGVVDEVLVAKVRFKKIWNLVADVKANSGQSIYIVDRQGRLVAHRNPSLVLRGTLFKVPDHDGIQSGLTGERAVIAVHTVKLGKQEFNIVAEQTTSEAFALAINSVRITAALVVIALLAAGILGFLIVRQIVRPIQDMAATARAVSAGDLSRRVEFNRSDELGVLAGAFNSMTMQLRTLINNLEQKVAERTTQLKDAQAELIRQERLATLGKLTATIAHEIRNPLATVNTSIFSIGAAMEKNDTERIKRALTLAERNVRRCDNIITELLDYTRKLEIRPDKVNIDRWMNGILDEQTFPEGIECRRNLNCGLEVRIDREHMRRAVINVITNAVHALSEENSPGNELTIETAISGQNLAIRIIDTGPGIPDNLQQKIFEPLFSTKGFGVGLGLSIAKDIMEKHHGGIDIKSKVGEGTTVILWMPLGER